MLPYLCFMCVAYLTLNNDVLSSKNPEFFLPQNCFFGKEKKTVEELFQVIKKIEKKCHFKNKKWKN